VSTKRKQREEREAERRAKTVRASIERKQREREGKSSPVYPTLSKRVHQTYGFSRNS